MKDFRMMIVSTVRIKHFMRRALFFIIGLWVCSAACAEEVSIEGEGMPIEESYEEALEGIPPVEPRAKLRKDTFTLSSAYLEGYYTNQQLATVGVELLRFWVRLEDFWGESSLLVKAGIWFGLYWMCSTFETAFHETGHGLGMKAFGYDYMLEHSTNGKPFQKNENFFKFFVNEFVNTKRAACRASGKWMDDIAMKIYRHEVGINSLSKDDYEALVRKSFVFKAGGINNNTYFSERLSNEIFEREDVTISEGVFYFNNQLYGALYAATAKKRGDDPYDMDLCWKTLGLSTKKKDMERAGYIATLTSGTTYRFLYAVWRAFAAPGKQVAPFQVYGVRVPDVFSYATSQGMSYKAVSSYKMDEQRQLLFGVEHVWYGKPATEFNLGLRHSLGKRWCNLSYKGVVTFGKGLCAEGSVSLPVLDSISFNVGGGTYSSKSLLGKRHSTNLTKDHSLNIFCSISYGY